MIETAGRLFRQEGYAGVGVARILEESGAPRGSLYHHFPGGKAQIAIEAADLARRSVLELIDETYADARTPDEGRAMFVSAVAEFFVRTGAREGCPVSVFLHGNGDQTEEWAARVRSIYDEWTNRLACHNARLGMTEGEAYAAARKLHVRLQGAWVIAIAERDPSVILQLEAS